MRAGWMAVALVLVVSGCVEPASDTGTSAAGNGSSTVTASIASRTTSTSLAPADTSTTRGDAPSSPASTSNTTATTITADTTTDSAVYSIDSHGIWPQPLTEIESVSGSGCSPGSNVLPDGVWFGLVRDLTGTSLSFDLACWMPVPEEDRTEGAAWVIRNDSPRLRTVPVAASALVITEYVDCDDRQVERADAESPAPMPYSEWMECTIERLDKWSQPPAWAPLVWVYVNGGGATEIAEPVIAG